MKILKIKELVKQLYQNLVLTYYHVNNFHQILNSRQNIRLRPILDYHVLQRRYLDQLVHSFFGWSTCYRLWRSGIFFIIIRYIPIVTDTVCPLTLYPWRWNAKGWKKYVAIPNETSLKDSNFHSPFVIAFRFIYSWSKQLTSIE